MPGSQARTPNSGQRHSLTPLQETINSIVARTPGINWSIDIRQDGVTVATHEPARVLNTASVGKIFVLWAVAEAFDEGTMESISCVVSREDDMVADSGLWQHMPHQEMTIESLCVLVAAVSDNLATNTLIRLLGLSRIQEVSDRLGYPNTRMLDRIRETRSSDDPPAPSSGNAGDLAGLMHRIGLQAGPVESRLAGWLALNTDLSMVASAWNFDPLAHSGNVGQRSFFNKTGTDEGVRADVGYLAKGGSNWSYAVLANCDEASGASLAMDGMREIGTRIHGMQ